MKLLMSLFISLVSLNAFAQQKCLKELRQELAIQMKEEGKWFDSLERITKSEAKELAETSEQIEDETIIDEVNDLIKQSGNSYFQLHWEVPNATGSNLVIVHSKTCKVLLNEMVFAEE